MFRHLLIPLDGSTAAEYAIDHAVALTRAFDQARITLIGVIETDTTGDAQPTDPLDWHMRKAQFTGYLEACKKRLEIQGIPCQVQVLEGNPGRQVVTCLKESAVDLVVLSTVGKSTDEWWLVGGVAQKIIMNAGVSILVVRPASISHHPEKMILYRRILVALDGSKRAECAIPAARQIARSHDGQLLLVHVVKQPEIPRQPQPNPTDIELARRLTENNLKYAAAYMGEICEQIDATAKPHVFDSDDVIMALQELVRQQSVDLTVLAAHGYSGKSQRIFGKYVLNAIFFTRQPLLIIQDLDPQQLNRQRSGHQVQDRRRGGAPPRRTPQHFEIYTPHYV